MRKAIVLSLVVTAFMSQTVFAEVTLLSDSFENYPAGASLTGNYGGWIPLYNAINDPVNNIFTDQYSSDGSISLQALGSKGGCWAGETAYEMAFPPSFFVEVDMMASGLARQEPFGCHSWDIGIGLGTYYTSCCFYGAGLAIILRDGGLYGVVSPLLTVTDAHQWYRLKMMVDTVNGTIDYWVDGNYLGQQSHVALIDTFHYLKISAGDGMGWIDKVRIYTDDTAPATTLSLTGTPGENGWYWSDVVVTLTAMDNGSGVARTEYSLDAGGTWNTYTGPFTVTAEGITVIDYRSIDNAGNVEPYLWDEVKIDRIAPVIVVNETSPLPANGATNVPVSQTITATFSENVQEGTNFANIKLFRAKIELGREVTTSNNVAGNVLYIDPVVNLNPETTYRVVIPAGSVKDLAGHPLAADFAPYSFETGLLP